MTIQNTDRSVAYIGNGATTNFDYDFRIPDASSIYVSLINLTTGVKTSVDAADFSITGLGSDDGGVVTYPKAGSGNPAIDSNTRILITREVPQTQIVGIDNLAKYDAGVVEGVWDRIVMMVQDLVGRITYNIRYPEGDTASNLLPDQVSRANTFLFFDGNGEPTVTSAVVSAPTTAWSADFLTANSAPQGLEKLGVDENFVDNFYLGLNAVEEENILDNAVSLSKMASGTPGGVVIYDANGDPADIGTGVVGQFLKSNGPGTASWSSALTAVDTVARANIAYILMTDLMSSTADTTILANGVVEKADALTVDDGTLVDGYVSSSTRTTGTTDMLPTFSGPTNGDITISGDPINPSYPAWQAFNDLSGPAIMTSGTGFIKIDFGAGNSEYIGKLRMTMYSAAAQHPVNWRIQGSNDDSNWDTLFTESSGSYAVSTQYTFDLSPIAAYRYYKVDILTSNGGAFACLQIELLKVTFTPGNIDAKTGVVSAISAPTTGIVYALLEGGTSADISLDLSSDNGVTFDVGTSLTKYNDVGGISIWGAEVSLTGGGTSIIARCVTSNNADMSLYDLGTLWD